MIMYMGIKQTISDTTLARLVKLARYNRRQKTEGASSRDEDSSNHDLSIEYIKEKIVEAYDCADSQRRANLLDEAAQMEHQLVDAYRSRGLKITADNITYNLTLLRKRQRRQS